MRSYLLLILVAVSAVLLWAMWSHSYVNTLVFSLGLLATGLCGYLIGDYFFNLEKKTWQSDLDLYKKESAALNEEVDILRKQAALTAPQTEIDGLRNRNSALEEEKNKVNGEFLAQAATIASLNTRLEALQREYSKVKEDAAINSESRSTELEAIRDTLTTAKEKISALSAENESLKKELDQYKSELYADNERLKSEAENFKNQLETYENKGTERAISTDDIRIEAPIEHSIAIVEEPIEFEESIEYQAIVVEKPINPDDLTRIVGIDDHIQSVLQKQGILTWRDLADTSVENIHDILQNAGIDYQFNNPISWPQQAHLLANGETDNFNTYVKHLSVKKTEPLEESGTRGIKKVPLFYNYDNATKKEEEQTVSDEADEDDTPLVEASSASDIEAPNNAMTITEANATSVEKPVEQEVHTVQMIAHPIYGTPDDLKAVEGIGPKIELLLKEAGIMTWSDLAEATVENLKGVLEKAGSRYRLNDPSSWPTQARMLADAEWDKFKEYTEYLIGGRTPRS